jgi:hypothetical protein
VLDLGALQVGGDEDEGPKAQRRCGGGRCSGEVACRRAGERVETEVDGARRGHRDRAVLERQRWIARVVLDPQPIDPDLGSQAVGADEGRRANLQSACRRTVDGKQLAIPPDVRRSSGDGGAIDGVRDSWQVVDDLERTETCRAHEGRTDRFGAAAVTTAETVEEGLGGFGRYGLVEQRGRHRSAPVSRVE